MKPRSQSACRKRLRHHVADQVVGNELAPRHHILGLQTQRSAPLHILPQQVSGGNLRDVIALDNPLGLCAFASAWRPQQITGPTLRAASSAIELAPEHPLPVLAGPRNSPVAAVTANFHNRFTTTNAARECAHCAG